MRRPQTGTNHSMYSSKAPSELTHHPAPSSRWREHWPYPPTSRNHTHTASRNTAGAADAGRPRAPAASEAAGREPVGRRERRRTCSGWDLRGLAHLPRCPGKPTGSTGTHILNGTDVGPAGLKKPIPPKGRIGDQSPVTPGSRHCRNSRDFWCALTVTEWVCCTIR